MKLCQIVPSLEERHGGPSKSVFDLSAALARNDPVELLSTAPTIVENREVGRLSVRVFPRDWPASLCPSSGLRDHLRSGSAGLIHHHSLWLRTLHYAHRTAVGQGARLVVSPRGMMGRWAWRHHRWRKRLAQTLVHPGALRAAHGWHATSEAEAAEIRSLGFTQPICVAPNGVHVPTAEQMAESARYWRTACPESADRPVALFYSRFHRKKRLLELIDAWLEQGPRDWLLLVAGIPQEYSVEMLQGYVLRSSGTGRVRVVSGVGRPAPYAIARLFLLPSHNENFGLVIAEALAHGVPALVTDTTPWAALNGNGGGWCVPWADYVPALRRALAEDPEALARRGASGRAWVREQYSWERPADALRAFYSRLGAV